MSRTTELAIAKVETGELPKRAIILPDRLRALLKERFPTQKLFLERCGISRSVFTRALKRVPTDLVDVKAIADTLGVTSATLIDQPIYREKPMLQTAMYEGMRDEILESQPRLIRVTGFQKPNPLTCGNAAMRAYQDTLLEHLRAHRGRLERIVAVHTLDRLFWLRSMLQDLDAPRVDAEVRVIDTPLAVDGKVSALPPICHLIGRRIFLANPQAIVPESAQCISSESPSLYGFYSSCFVDLWSSCASNVVFDAGGVVKANLRRVVYSKGLDILRHANRPGQEPADIIQALAPVSKAFPDWFEAGYAPPRDRPYSRRVVTHAADAPFEIMLAYWHEECFPCLPHDHGGADGAFLVLRGAAEIKRYASRNGKLGDVLHCTTRSEGGADLVQEDIVHSTRPLQPGTVTLHIYRQPMDCMNVFDPSSHEGKRVFPSSGAWL